MPKAGDLNVNLAVATLLLWISYIFYIINKYNIDKNKRILKFIMSIQFQVEYRFRAQLHRTKKFKILQAFISLSVYNQN